METLTKRLLEIDAKLREVNEEIATKEANDPTNSWDDFRRHMQPLWDKAAKLSAEMRMIMIPEFQELSEYGDVMSLKEFISTVKSGGFIDYDGFGKYVKNKQESNIHIYPSDIKHGLIRKDFNQIIWFNK
jgi:hypothetical protein